MYSVRKRLVQDIYNLAMGSMTHIVRKLEGLDAGGLFLKTGVTARVFQ